MFFYIADRLPNFAKGAVDRTGNGAYLAEVAAQRYGEKIIEVAFTQEWYRIEMPPFIQSFSDGTNVIPRHDDVLQDLQALQYVDGVIRIPKDFRLGEHDAQ